MSVEELLIKYYGEEATYAFGKLYKIGTRRVYFKGDNICQIGRDKIVIKEDRLIQVGDNEVDYLFNKKIKIGNILFHGPRKSYIEIY